MITGILSAKTPSGTKVIDDLLEALNIGYIINWEVMNAAEYGVPQRRRRVIIVGLMGDMKFVFLNPPMGGKWKC